MLHHHIDVTQCSAPALNVAVNGYNQVTTYTYDNNGDVLSDGSYNYTWNDEGQMKTAASVTHTYDGDGQRVEKSSGSYFWFTPGGMLLGETNTSGTTQNEYVYFGGARVAANVPTNTVYYYFSDQVGSLQLVTNSAGTVCYDSDNTPNGYKWSHISTCAQEFGLAGMKLEAEAPIYHTWFRQYSDNAGRWISPDPLGGDASNPQSLNRYAYVLNNPCSLTDTFGLDACSFNIAVNNSGLISQSQMNTLEQTLSNIFKTAGVGVNFNFSGAADYSLDVTTSASGLGFHQTIPGLTEGSPQDLNAGGETPMLGNSIANYGMVYVDRFMSVGYSGSNLAVALGDAGAHEAGHGLLQIADSPRNMGIMAPTINGPNWSPAFTGGQGILLQDKCNKLHPPTNAGGGGGAENGGFDPYGSSLGWTPLDWATWGGGPGASQQGNVSSKILEWELYE